MRDPAFENATASGSEAARPLVEVRQATAGERETALAIMLDAAERQAGYGFSRWDEASLVAALDAALPRGEVFMALLGGEAAGAMILQWSDPAFWGERPEDAGYVHKLAVAGRRAGSGVGSALLCWAERRVRERGRLYVRLDCQAENERMNRYYQDAGYLLRGQLLAGDDWLANLYEKPLLD